jgi:starvation-inducible DNA-binding protein
MNNISKLINKLHFVSSKLHMFHWNVKGPNFISYHEFLEEGYKQIIEQKDKIAEYLKFKNINQNVLIDFNEVAKLNQNFTIPKKAEEIMQETLNEYKSLLQDYSNILEEADKILEAIISEAEMDIQKQIYILQSILS